MSILINYVLSFITTVVTTTILIKKPLTLSIPSDRGLHNERTPSSGGIAIFFGLLLFADQFPNNIMYALLFSTLIGFLDDRFSLSKTFRFLSQLVIALLVILPNAEYSLIILFWIIFIIYFINIYNFMDGIDSLASIQSIYFIMSLALLYGFFPIITIPIISFLFFNITPAKIFLGNSGSYLLGTLLASYIFNMGYDFQYINEIIIYIILLTIFLADATYTLLRRFIYKFKEQKSSFMDSIRYVTEPHCTHNYQILAKRYNNHGVVTLILMVYNIFWCLPLAYLISIGEQSLTESITFLLLSYFPYFIWCYKNKAGLPQKI